MSASWNFGDWSASFAYGPTLIYFMDGSYGPLITWDSTHITFDSDGITFDVGSDSTARIDLEITETDRLAGMVTLNWNGYGGANSYDLYDNEAVLAANVQFPYTITGIAVDTSHLYKVVAKDNNGVAIWQSNEIAFRYGSTEILTVTPMARPGPYPYFPSVVVQ